MKKILSTLLALACVTSLAAQTAPAPRAVPIGVYVSDNPEVIPTIAQASLTNKMRQIVTSNGMGADNRASFFITCTVNVTDKEIMSGPPMCIVQNADVTFYIVDAQTDRIMETTTVQTRGVGETDNKAYISAFKAIQPKSSTMKAFVASANNKIIGYYESQIDNIIRQADALAKTGDFEAALYALSAVPDVCEGYDKVNAAAVEVYQKMIDEESIALFRKAKTVWAAGQDYASAAEAGEYLAEISPYSSCYGDAETLAAEIKEFVRSEHAYERAKEEDALARERKLEDEALAWERKMDTQRNKLRSQEIAAWKEVGVAYGQNQQPVTYNDKWLY